MPSVQTSPTILKRKITSKSTVSPLVKPKKSEKPDPFALVNTILLRQDPKEMEELSSLLLLIHNYMNQWGEALLSLTPEDAQKADDRIIPQIKSLKASLSIARKLKLKGLVRQIMELIELMKSVEATLDILSIPNMAATFKEYNEIRKSGKRVETKEWNPITGLIG